ncbi:MAG: signal recognition particle-docking protein FtsY [Bacteroidota bacterium]|nr:signal recognition particle-docking protein FtsY [Bacteroidota bacterium]
MGIFDFFTGKKEEAKQSLDKGLEKTRTNFLSNLGKAILGKSTIDAEVLDNLEEMLISADVGVETTLKIIQKIENRVSKDKYLGTAELDKILKEEIASLLAQNQANNITEVIPIGITKPYVIMVVGVNGAGKTTTVGKLASQFAKNNLKVVLGAADTFRAAAVDQLKEWSTRAGVGFISHGMNTDPSAVAFDAIKQGVETQADVVIIDTAGRLHNKTNLMNELSKIKKVMQKIHSEAPHEVLLVLDGSTGQNALNQAVEFMKATEITALAITKLDGTAKGGVVIGISDQLQIPVKYIGVGEKIDDLQLFNRELFVATLFNK